MPLLTSDPSTFPVEPTHDLTDIAAIATHGQTAFDALDEMIDHWSRPGWADGTQAYYWLLAFPDVPALSELALRCQEALAPLRLDPVPTEWLHVTLLRAASPGSTDTEHLRRLVDTARTTLPEAFSLQDVPLAGSRGAVRLSLAPWEPLVRLHAALATASASVGLPVEKPTALFRPHLSLANNNRRRDAAPVIETVTPLRSLPSVELSVAAVQLVKLERRGAEYRWEVLESLPLRVPERTIY